MENTFRYMGVVPLRGLVVYPYTSINFDAGREMSVKALEEAVNSDSYVMLVAQREFDAENPKPDDLFGMGTIAKVRQIMRMPGGVTRVVAEGLRRGRICDYVETKPYLRAYVEEIYEDCNGDETIDEAYEKELKHAYEEYFAQNTKLSPESFTHVMAIGDITVLCDVVASKIDLRLEVKQQLLEIPDIYKRIEYLIAELKNQLSVIQIEKEIAKKVKARIDKNQHEYYLREQLKVIQEELGDDEGINADAKRFKDEINRLKTTKDTKEKLLKEVDRFMKMPANSAESAVLRTYLDTVLQMPWNKESKEEFDISRCEEVLNEDHYGLETVKDRILEYLSVRKFTGGKNGTILCLVGPPGVGKTSVAKSVARSLGRKYIRISLGGVHDESDIRGHRKTYIGAMEGRIMAAMKEVKVKNPLILLDEIDKMGVDYKGDPSAALLEVLDYEQNGAFRDHYLEVPFDLSKVLFITTANTLDTISRPLLDRMEIISLSGYTEIEKFHIAKDYLVKKARENNGLSDKQFKINDAALKKCISSYTKEAGVRGLEQTINKLCRKSAKVLLSGNKKSVSITTKNLSEFLGKEKYTYELMSKKDQVGVARGLAWTAVGGDTLSIETNIMPGSGKVELTGKLGDVMKESAMAAISYIRSNTEELHIDEDFHKTKDIHIHVPEGAVPKDGPSAGITMATALVSSLTHRPIRRDVAMTGEITLRGRVLPIGGLKEKSLAAHRAGIRTIIIPSENKPDIDDIPKDIVDDLHFIPVDNMSAVLENALV